MSSIQVREVNVVPVTKLKKELIEDDEPEDRVICLICSKGFVSEMAVRNHARMEHITEFMAGADLYKKIPIKTPKTTETKTNIKAIATKLVSTIKPSTLASLASKDGISYIIFKDQDSVTFQKMNRLQKHVKQAKSEKQPGKRGDREVKPISGPFECLQPSSSNAQVLCHQMFLSCCEYSVHFRDEHTRRRKGHRCQVCEKPLTGDGDQLVPYVCQLCGEGFEDNKLYEEHTQTAHVKLKPFQCSVCLKRFTQQGGLQQHMRRHTGDRPFQCSYCPKAFTQKSGRDQHMRIHTKEKPYRCVICSKAFCQSVHLQQHMRTHTNVAPFQCGICQKRFKQSSHLNYHLKYHNMAKMTDEQKQKYAELVSKIKNDYMMQVETENAAQHIGQSIIIEPDIDQSDMMQEEIDQTEMTREEIDQTEIKQEEMDQSESQDNGDEEIGETVYILNEGDHDWCEDVVYEQ